MVPSEISTTEVAWTGISTVLVAYAVSVSAPPRNRLKAMKIKEKNIMFGLSVVVRNLMFPT